MGLFRKKATPERVHPTRPTVLLVDDEPDICELMQIALRSRQYDVILAHDGREALEKLETIHPHVMILDIMMPHVNGYEVLTRIHQNHELAGLPVIVTTSLTGDDNTDTDDGWAKRLGVARFFSKPFDADAVVQAVDDLIAERTGAQAHGQ